MNKIQLFILIVFLVSSTQASNATISYSWHKLKGHLKYVSINAKGEVWGINNQQNIYYLDDVSKAINTNAWTQIPGHLTQISTNNDTVIGANNVNQAWQYHSGNKTWTHVQGNISYISVSDDSNNRLCAINASNKEPMWKSDVYTSWQNLGGSLIQIQCNEGYYVGVNSVKDAFSKGGASQSWIPISAVKFKYVTTKSQNEFWGIDLSDNVYFKNATNWYTLNWKFSQISVRGNYIIGVNSNDEIYYTEV